MGLLRKIRRSLFGEDWGPKSLDVPAAWRRAGGGGVRVLVIDTGAPVRAVRGAFRAHAAFTGSLNLGLCQSFVYGEDFRDRNGHGTAVAGVVRDWAPRAEIVCYKVTPEDAASAAGTSDLVAALRAAIYIEPHIVNLSLGAQVGLTKVRKAVAALAAQGALVVAGSGNDPERPSAIAKFPDVLSVGACGRDGKAARFSASAGLLMPGVDIRAPWKDGGYRIASGTSLAAAAASGLAALALSAAVAAGGHLEPMTLRAVVAAVAKREGGAA